VTTARRRPLTAETEFLNVDFNVKSRTSLEPLRSAWPGFVQDVGSKLSPKRQWLLLHVPRQPTNSEGAIRAFMRIIAGLPKPARDCLMAAGSRTFDIGVQVGLKPYSFEEVRLSHDALLAVARVRATILVTMYAPGEGA
jgi:hypothetical protein